MYSDYVQTVSGSVRRLHPDETIVPKSYVVDSGRAHVELVRARLARRAADEEAKKLKQEVADLKDLLKQAVEYAWGTRLKPVHGTRRLVFGLGSASHLNLEIERAPIGADNRVIKVWAPEPPDPDADLKAAIATQFTQEGAAGRVLQRLREAGLDITLKNQGKGETTEAATPSLAPVSYMSRGGG